MLEKVKRSQVRGRRDVEEIGPERLVKREYEAEMKGRKGRGRPREKWNDDYCISKDNLLQRRHCPYC